MTLIVLALGCRSNLVAFFVGADAATLAGFAHTDARNVRDGDGRAMFVRRLLGADAAAFAVSARTDAVTGRDGVGRSR